MNKIQQYFVLKINSSRLKDSNYKIKQLTLDQARLNGEVISLSNSQMIRTIQKLTNKEFSQSSLSDLQKQKTILSRQKNKKQNRAEINSINKKIDEMLYIPEIISVAFDDKRHFYNILNSKQKGILVNGIRYVPFMASAGMIRRDTYLFIDDKLEEEINNIFDNERNKETEIVPAKFSAYVSLYTSSTLPVSFPKIVVVPDLIIKSIRKVDFSTYVGVGVDPKIEETEMEIESNAFDGQGLVSPSLAKEWALELGITDYVPSIFGVRAPFLKGMAVVFDFHEFGKEIAGKNIVSDIYGNEIDIKNIDCVITESMFKLWNSYEKTEDYVESCKKNDLEWGITKVNAKVEKTHAKSSYQFIQPLDLSDDQIERLCWPTLNWLDSVSAGDISSTLLYTLGETEFSDGWFDRLDNPIKALILENSLLNDSFFISYFDKSLSKKKNDAKIGRLIFSGNYQTMIADPYALVSHVFGIGLNYLLNEHQHYSKYWNDRDKKEIVAIRSPIVHSSEVNILNFVKNEFVDYWYRHITSGIIFPANGVGMDCNILGGADYDLDIVCTFDSPEFIEGRVSELPVLYETKKPEKIKINNETKDKVVSSQVEQIKSNKIGFLTNVSSTFYSLLYSFKKGTPEHNAILNRLKYGRVSQGLEIDRTKGLLVDPFPEHFVKWKKIKDEMTEDEKSFLLFNNSILAEGRPYFMRWLYSHYNRRYLNELAVYNNISRTKWNIPFEELVERADLNEEQESLVNKFKRKSYFINNNSTMNRVSKYVEKKLKDIRFGKREKSKDFDYTVLLSNDFRKPNKIQLDKMLLLFKEYKSLKRGLRESFGEFDNTEITTVEQIFSHINKRAYLTISSEARELADIAVYMCYGSLGKTSRNFCWQIFGKEIVENIKSKKNEKFVRVPMPNQKGNIEYLWNKYGTYLLNIEE